MINFDKRVIVRFCCFKFLIIGTVRQRPQTLLEVINVCLIISVIVRCSKRESSAYTEMEGYTKGQKGCTMLVVIMLLIFLSFIYFNTVHHQALRILDPQLLSARRASIVLKKICTYNNTVRRWLRSKRSSATSKPDANHHRPPTYSLNGSLCFTHSYPGTKG